MADYLEQLLDECIDRIAFQGETIQDCLARHSQHAAELEPYLRIVARYAAAFQEAPAEAAKELGRQRLKTELEALRAMGASSSPQLGQLTPPPPTFVPAAAFDEALDQCITRILRGESVEACLASYPTRAAELAPHLRIAAMAVEAAAVQVDATAKAQGWRRLQAELAALQWAGASLPASRSPWPSLGFALPQRWAVASIAAAFALFLGGFSLVSASDNALPGQTLYPVKRAAEEVRLVLDFSPEAKAHRYLSYAERRGQEISLLIQLGEQTKVSDPQAALEKHIASAATIAAELNRPEAVSNLKTRFEQNASVVLAELQTSLQSSREEARQRARESFKSVGQAYGEGIQDIAAKAPKVVASPGILQLRATNPFPPGIEAVLLEVGQIEAHRADWPEDRWIAIATSSQELDLLRLGEVQKFLGELEVPAGTYTKLRIAIQEAKVVVGGVAYPVQVPGGMLHVTRPFRVEAGKTTVALLDFEGAASLRAPGVDSYILNPQVQLLAREPHKVKEKGKETDTPSITEKRQTVVPAATPELPSAPAEPPRRGEGKVELLEVEGDIKQVLEGAFQVGNKSITLPPGMDRFTYEIELREGQRVKVEVAVQPDGTFLAQEIRAARSKGLEKPEDDAPGRATPTPRVMTLQGILEAVAPQTWSIAGHTVRISLDTRINGIAFVGARVEVKGVLQVDGTLLAREITINSIAPSPTPGSRKGDKGTDREREEKSQEVHIKGTLRLDSPGVWSVDGRRVIIGANTEVRGAIVVGREVEVVGKELPDGTVRAVKVTSIRSSRQPGNGTSPTPTPARPTPASTPTPTPTRPQREGRTTIATPAAVPTATPPSTIQPRRTLQTPEAEEVKFEGVVEAMIERHLVVDGHRVEVASNTKIEGIIAVGVKVRVEGEVGDNGVIMAVRLRVIL